MEQITAWLTDRTGMSSDELASQGGLFSDGVLDSFDLIELVQVVEGVLGRRLPAMDVSARTFDTLGKIDAYITRAKAK